MNIEQIQSQLVANENYVSSPMLMGEVFLPKPLQKLCGGAKSIKVRASNFAHIVRALEVMFGVHVKQFILANAWLIKFGSNRKDYIDQSEVHNLGTFEKIYMYFKIQGAGRIGQIIVGVVLVVVGSVLMYFGNPYGLNVLMMGAGMLLNVLLTPRAQAARAAPDENASYLFDSPTNVVEQGGAVPLAYGRSLVGSVVMTVGIDTEQLEHYSTPVGRNIAPDSVFGIQLA